MKGKILLLVEMAAALTLIRLSVLAQAGAPLRFNSHVVDIPNIGAVDLDELPPEIRDNLRIPGVVYDDPPSESLDSAAPPAKSGGA